MNQKKKKNLTHWLSVIVIGITLGFALQFVRAWTEPTTAPPGGNVGAPINTGANVQTKGEADHAAASDICVWNSGVKKCMSSIGTATTTCNNNGTCDAGEDESNCYNDCHVTPSTPSTPTCPCGTCGATDIGSRSCEYYLTPDASPSYKTIPSERECRADGWFCTSGCDCAGVGF